MIQWILPGVMIFAAVAWLITLGIVWWKSGDDGEL